MLREAFRPDSQHRLLVEISELSQATAAADASVPVIL